MTDATLERDQQIGMSLGDVSALMAEAAMCKSRVEELLRTAEMERDRINDWLSQESASDSRRIAEIEAVCEEYLRQRLDTLQPGDKKSVTTPHGSIESRQQPPAYERDDAVLATWVREHGFIRIKTTEEIDWKRIKDEAVPDGEGLRWHGDKVPGVEVVQREPAITVKIW